MILYSDRFIPFKFSTAFPYKPLHPHFDLVGNRYSWMKPDRASSKSRLRKNLKRVNRS